MGSQMPELGAKISLISKADIRYEGRLFQVDPTECTIALANVRSFGTEDRETMYPVPAQNQIYEYILFRGSDIKDIRIVQSVVPQDPAIVQLVPHQQPQQTQNPPFQSSGLGHSAVGQSGHPLGGFGYGGLGLGLRQMPGPLMMQPSELGSVLRPTEPHPGPSALDKDPDLISGGSRSTTPLARKSPTIDQGTQVNKSPPREEPKKHPKPIQPPDRDNRDKGRRDYYQPNNSQGGYRPRDGEQRRPFHENNRQDYVRNDAYNNRRPNFRREPHDNLNRNQNNRQQVGDGQQSQQHQQQQQQHHGGWVNRNQNNQQQQQQQGMQHQVRQPHMRGNRGRGGIGRQMNRSGAPQANRKNPLKFEDDYDFDKANTEFEELKSQLNKLKVSDEPVAGEVKPELEKKEDSGNETGTGEPETGEDEVYYDKKKSFFDSISCEAVERSKGRSQRTDWRTERKLNTETFGVSSARRGMFRGRGYYGGGRNYGYRPRNPQQNAADAPTPAVAAADPLPPKVATSEEVTDTPAVAVPADIPSIAVA